MRVENVFEIGSMTKQFTAISILMLMETSKLSLKDEITKFIPDYPVHGKIITVHHLLTHTSGIKDYTSMKELMNISKQDLTPAELINFFKNEPMDFSPAENYKYNNSGYIILGHIIEKISGKSYADFVEENIFKKLGMISSYYASHSKIFKNRVTGYQDENGFKKAMQVSFTLPYAAGALISNVDDMLKWQTALVNYKLIKKETLELAFTNYTLNNGDKINYGYGWNVKEIHGMSSLEHGGSIFGFKSMGVYILNKNIYVIGLNNCDCNSPTLITKEIAALVIEIVKK
jgi:CubicO group peptidase (beta-lactamase class C family)